VSIRRFNAGQAVPFKWRLLHNGNGYYQLNWKSPKTYANSCKAIHLDLEEGVTRNAYFRFPK
jgi:hypothetical protein